MDKLSALIIELESKIPQSEKQNFSVSATSVGWHIQHSLLVAFQIIKAVESSDPANYLWKFNLKRIIVYTLNKFPRGKGKAPDSVQPKGETNRENLVMDIQALKTRIKILQELKPNHFFVHPYFGKLNVKATIKMLKIHTKHHIHIMNDIIKVS
jgi:hypothetical protein